MLTVGICCKSYSAELILNIRCWIECDDCKSTFHFKCILKTHLEAFGIDESDEDDLQFICHICTNDIDSSDLEVLI